MRHSLRVLRERLMSQLKMLDSKTALELVTQPEEYFKELLTEALYRQQMDPQPETEVYLINLLSRFIQTENLFTLDADGKPIREPLAFMVKEAQEESSAEGKKLLFRQLGDVSLYTAGYFQEFVSAKNMDVDYYIGIGGGAYHRVAELDPVSGAVYGELSERFSEFVDVLAVVGEKTTPIQGESDLLKVYERWVSTKSERARRILERAGIFPDDSKN